jgi:hypothetical protein
MTLETMTFTAWELIGFDGTTEVIDRLWLRNSSYAEPGYEAEGASVRIRGGRALYEAVGNDGGELVRLTRLAIGGPEGLRVVVRYVDPDTELEVIVDEH